MSDYVSYIDQTQFEEQVLSSDRPVVLDFYSTECPPCEALAAKFEPLAALYAGAVRFLKIFRQENRELAQRLGVTSSPTVLFFHEGTQRGEVLRGAIKRADLVRNIDAMLPADVVAAVHGRERRVETEVDIAILGGGPAGLTAAIYAAQAKLHTLLIDPGLPGGNVSVTHQVSNYPGFVEPQPGYLIAHYMGEQAKAAGAEFRVAVDVTGVDLENRTIEVDGIETVRAKKIIVATGTSPRLLNIPGESEYKGKGVSYCATCDAKYFEGKHAVVVGGGNSAVEEALFIAKFAAKITVVHQFDRFQANAQAAQRLLADPKVTVLWNHEPRAFEARTKDAVDTVVVEDLRTGARTSIACDGVFVFVGQQPNLAGIDAPLARDEWGYLVVDESMRTNIPHVFAAGDIVHKRYRQITTAVADGTVAAIAAAAEIEAEAAREDGDAVAHLEGESASLQAAAL